MLNALRIHKELLEKWRKAMDLVGPGPVEHHFEDAKQAVDHLNATGNWIDLGSGAGFPGFALAAYHPKAHVLLVESRQKRAQFLKRVISQSGLKNIELYHGRSEDIKSTFDGVISRAYKQPLAYLNDAKRLSSPNARTVLLLGGHNYFAPPLSWNLLEDWQYSISTGLRRRLVLCESMEQDK